MRREFTLEYWKDGDWFVGRLVEIPGVFSQGKRSMNFVKTFRMRMS